MCPPLCILQRFQSQGRFFGGCCWAELLITAGVHPVSIAGAILWGVLRHPGRCARGRAGPFQSQGRFFGGCCFPLTIQLLQNTLSFNRRGDSLGGAALRHPVGVAWPVVVSIAGAILWGVLHDEGDEQDQPPEVSIAGAILWGVLHPDNPNMYLHISVSIAGAILWGVLPRDTSGALRRLMFQSQGRFFGGCCVPRFNGVILHSLVSIAGAILWGVLPPALRSAASPAAVSIAGAILWGVLLS